MKTGRMTVNRTAVGANGKEKYQRVIAGAFFGKPYVRYDYTHTDGTLFSTVQATLDECRDKRDSWLMTKVTVHAVVNASNTASTVGSGDLDVFSTPAMIALMERAASEAVAPALTEGSTTVGISVNVAHTRAIGIGGEISASAVLQQIDGRRLIFSVTASDSHGIIGEGTHERVIVDRQRFMSKVNS